MAKRAPARQKPAINQHFNARFHKRPARAPSAPTRAPTGLPHAPLPPTDALLAFVERVGRMLPYCYEDGCEAEGHTHGGVTPDGSWTDDQAEDALTTLNALIAEARALTTRVGVR